MASLLRQKKFLMSLCMTLIFTMIVLVFPGPVPWWQVREAEAETVTVTKSIQPDDMAGMDTHIYGESTYANYNNSTSQNLLIGRRTTTYSPVRGLEQFDLSSIPSNAIITKADLKMYFYGGSSTTPMDISVHRINRSWTESGATWNKYDGVNTWTNAGADFDLTPESTVQGIANTPGWYTWEITDLTRGWFNGTIANNGVLLKGTESGTTAFIKYFYTSDWTDPTFRPQLLVTYTTSDNTEPSANISSPIEGQTISGTNKIKVNANDNVELAKVEVYCDDQLIHTENRPDVINWSSTSFEYAWNTEELDGSGNRKFVDGAHTINAKGYDTAGNIVTISRNVCVDNSSPKVTRAIQPDGVAGKDAYIRSDGTYSTYNYGIFGSFIVGQISTGSTPARGLLQYDLSSIPSNAAVTNAELKMYYSSGTNTAVPMDVSVHSINRSWTEGTGSGSATNNGATWTKYDGINLWTSAGGDYDTTPESIVTGITNTFGYYTWDITGLAQGWANGTITNNGILIKGSIESGRPSATYRCFSTSDEAVNPDTRPQLIVTYTVDDTPPDLEISSPSANQYITGSYNITGTTNDLNFRNTKIEYGQGLAPTSWNEIASVTSPVNNGVIATWDTLLLSGQYTLRVTATDYANNTTVETIPIFIDSEAPNVLITSPADQDTVQGSVYVTGLSTDNIGTSYMELFAKRLGHKEEVSLGTVTATNGTWTWDTNKFVDGEYILKLVAYDNAGSQGTSQIKVKVNNNPQKLGLESYWGSIDGVVGEINLSNGNFVLGENDIKIPGRGLGIDLTRTYNSQSKFNGPLGWGWSLNIPEFSEYSDGSVVITDEDGTEHTYTLNQDGSYSGPVGKYVTLTKNANNSFTWQYKDGRKYIFDEDNQKVVLADKNDNTVVYQYDSLGKLTSITDPSDRVTTIQYDPTNGSLSSVTDFVYRTWSYSYDTSGNLKSVIDPMGYITAYGYDANHCLTSITDPRGNTISLSYTGEKLISTTDPLSNSTLYSYDTVNSSVYATNALGFMTGYIYNANGNLISETDPLNNTTTYGFDGNNNLISTTDALGHTTTFTNDTMGNKLSETDALNRTTTYEYNSNNDVTITNKADGNTKTYGYDNKRNLTSLNDAGKTTTYSHDGYGQKTSETDPKGNTIYFDYDSYGNLIEHTDAMSKITRFSFDDLGNKISDTDANNNTTSYKYDDNSRLINVTDALDNITSYSYDANGNKLSVIDAKGNTSSYEYDVLNRLTRTIESGKTKTTEYDAVGNVTEEILENGQTITYSYDEADRLEQTTYSTGKTVSYTYDKVDNRLSMTDAKGTTTYSYDAANQLSQEVGPTGKTITYNYDAVGALVGKTVAGKSENFAYDSNKNLISVTNSSGNTTYSYDLNNNRTAMYYPNGTRAQYSYNDNNYLTTVQNYTYAGNILSDFGYTYDATGKRLTESETVVDEVYGQITKTTSYLYDDLNRLIKITNPDGQEESYTYDAVGNRLTLSNINGSTTYEYDVLTNQLLQVVAPAGTIAYTYDAKGNVITKNDNTGITTYTYDPENRLTQVIKPDGSSVTYAYDGDNRRISKTTAEGVITYIYDEDLVVAETDENGTVFVTYTYDDRNIPISMTKNDSTYYYQYNGHGDVIALTDVNGIAVRTYKYDVWGNIISQSGSLDNPYLYAGYRYDNETGLYFLQSRYYDPQIGRFISKDRFSGFDEAPQTQNKYTYCENDPINKVDPSGEIAIPLFGAVVIVAVAVVGYYAIKGALKAGVNAYYSSKTNTRQGPVGKQGLKKQGREVNETKRQNPKWKPNPNKNPNRPMPKHTPGRDHIKPKPR